MSKDDIIDMAKQAGMVQDGNVWFSANNYEQCDVHTAELEAFAKLVAAKEREACAKICEEWAVGWPHPSTVIAESIRKRGEA